MIDRTELFAKGFLMKLIPLLAVFSLILAAMLPSPATAQDSGSFRHFVSFQFKEGTTDDDSTRIIGEFMELKNKIDTIVSIEWGTSENVEPLNDGFTHSFLVTFKDRAGLEAYLPHPAHEEFKKILKPHLKKVYVFDYTARD